MLLLFIGVVIGFEEIVILLDEGAVREVCAVLLDGTLERDAIVTASSADDSATGKQKLMSFLIERTYINHAHVL